MAVAEKVRADSLAKALAELQPELAAARAAGVAQKEARRLTIDRRSQVSPPPYAPSCNACNPSYDYISVNSALQTIFTDVVPDK